jgi:serine/threonine-protein kinase
MPRPTPFTAGPFECSRFLGGDWAELYEARHQPSGRPVTLKLLRVDDPEVSQRFQLEGQVGLSCAHPNIIPFLDTGVIEGMPCHVLAPLAGDTLRLQLERGQIGHDVRHVMGMAWQIALALQYLHERQIVHRDLKPDNFVGDAQGRVQLIDLGIAHVGSAHLTKIGQLLGTPLFMSPEQVLGEPAAAATDIYSFGVLCFQLLTGTFPYRGSTRLELFDAIVGAVPDLRPLESRQVPPGVIQLIERCLRKQAADRPGSFADIATVLRVFASPEMKALHRANAASAASAPAPPPLPESPPVSTPPPSVPVAPAPRAIPAPAPAVLPRRSGWPLLAAATLLLAGTAGFYWWNQREPARPDMVPAAGFAIDRTEVTNAEFLAFCRATGHQRPPGIEVAAAENPVVNVTFADAQAFAQWRGKRLPSRAEWEQAVRGNSRRPLPWGPRFDAARVNIPEPGGVAHRLAPADSYPQGAAENGALQLLGNVWEWTSEPASLDPVDLQRIFLHPPLQLHEDAYQIRGGSFQQAMTPQQIEALVSEFAVAPARLRRTDLGFRCVR